MPQVISVSQARNNFSELINQAYYQGRQFLVKKTGRPMAVLIRVDDLLDLTRQANQSRNKRFKDLLAIAKKNKKVPFSETKKDISEAIVEVRAR